VTEEDGKFSFSFAEPSFASVQVSRTNYMATAFRRLSDGERSLTVKLVPLGATEGRVVDADGEPLAGISIQLIQGVIEDGRKIFRVVAGVGTDDRGHYRFWNLTPGSYYVKALGRQGITSRVGGISTPPETDHAYPTVYYPGVLDRQSANLLQVRPGQTANADFTLEARKSYRVRGVIKDPASHARLGARLMRDDEGIGNRVSIDTASGAFVIYDVTPGAYTLQAFAPGVPAMAMGETPITVGEQNLSGVEVALSTGVAVRGKLERLTTAETVPAATDLDDDAPIIVPQRTFFPPVQAVILQPGRLPVAGTQPPATVDQQGNFTFTDMLPGKYAFTVAGFGESVTSIRSGSTDVSVDGLEVGTTPPEPLVITLTSGRGTIRGSVAGLEPGESATVALVRANGSSGVPTITQAFQRPRSSDLEFQAPGLPPGDYTIYAWPSTRQVEYRNPEALGAILGKAVRVTLPEGGNEQVALEVVSVEN